MNTPDLQDPFAPHRTWDDVRQFLEKYLSKRYPTASRVTIEDAVGETMVRLIDYWVTTEGSLDGDPWRNYARAKFYGERYAKEEMWRTTKRSIREPLEVDKDWKRGITLAPKYDPLLESAEEVALSNLEAGGEREQLHKLLADVPSSEWDGWLGDYLAGKSVRQVQAETGVSKSEVDRRRSRGMRRLQRRAREMGLL